MKRVFFTIAILISFQSYSQLLTWSPDFIDDNSTPVVITVDAAKGNHGLLNYNSTSDVYVHTGVITNLSSSNTDWKYVKFNQNFNQPNPALQAIYLGSNKWQFTFSGGVRFYYGVPVGETILKIAILFRSGDGSKVQRNADLTDMYVPVYTSSLAIRFTDPLFQPTFTPQAEPLAKNIGDNISLTGIANIASTLKLYLNGSVIQTALNVTTISANPTIATAGDQTIVLEGDDGSTTKTDTLRFFVHPPAPAGLKQGINYGADNTSVTLVLYAPSKTSVAVIGDFPGSNWTVQPQYQMTKSADGFYWTLQITGLTPGTEYSYQFLVDGTLKIADPYAEKVLDLNADAGISSTTYPGLKAYPTGLTSGIVSILQTASSSYTWAVNSFNRPDKRNLIIYELLVRDFVAAHDWNTLRDTLSYLKNLGINAIELMPFNEFEGNSSWGYNPDFYFAPDKYYGPKNTLKEFIDSCHSNGIAVIMDMVLNHSFGQSPMVQLYWDNVNNRPATDNPWFNPLQKHAFNVGYDMNHESSATKYFVSRVLEHWVTDYKIDGFRFDLSKGFTQVQTCDANGNNCNVGAWSSYDATRVAIWKGYQDTLQLKSPGAYNILEHLGENTEEKELSDYGMMPWGNLNYNYNQASMGYSTDWDFNYGIFTSRGWANSYLVTYMESHDEERLMFKNLQFGNVSGSYDTKSLSTALKRMELDAAFFFTIPGPKMVWQFGELGYDYPINYCQDGSVNNNCRTDPKPIKWNYLQDADRKHLHDVYSSLIKLRFNPYYSGVFTSNQIEYSLSGAFKWLKVTEGISSLVVIGNFDVVSQTGSVIFPLAGTWYDYLNGTTITATGAAQPFTLQPGEYHVYLNRNAALPVSLISFSGKNIGASNLLTWNVTNEHGLGYYELERSTNGQTFFVISKVARTGNSNYNYSDNFTSNSPVLFYRLKSTDKDGQYAYSAVVKLRIATGGIFAKVSPNPFTEKLNINIESALKDNATIIVADFSGRQLYKKKVSLFAGSNAFQINETSGFSKGTYLLTVISLHETQSFKIFKNN
jgi:1,4-alpha-glucan branching enzyme